MNTVRETSSTSDAETGRPNWQTRAACLLLIVASMMVITARLADSPVMRSANDRSRWCTVWSIVERQTYQIDEIHNRPGWSTIDQVKHHDHFYSSKPPLLPRLVAELYRGLKLVTGWTLTEQTALVTRTLLFLINVIPMGIALVLFSGLIARTAQRAWTHLFIMTCACWGMLLLPFLTVFNNHTVAASCFFMVLPMAAQILVEGKKSGFRYFLCGVLAAFGVCNELPAALFGLALFCLLLADDAKKTLWWFLPGALIVLGAFFWTNYQATGSLKPFYSRYGTETYEFVHEGVPSYWKDPKGIDKPRDSTLTYLFHCTFGHHGIFSLSPIFLLTLGTWLSPPLYWHSRLKRFHLLGIVLSIVTLGFYLTKTENYNYGGMSVALRWMMWLIPFWLLSMIPLLDRLGHRIWFRLLSTLLLCVSIFSAWYPTNTPWAQNWIYQLMSQAKWIDYSDPAPKFLRKHYTWLGSLPDGELQTDYQITFQSPGLPGASQLIRLQDGGPVNAGERLILVGRNLPGSAELVETGYVFGVAQFRAGQPVEEFLLRRQDGTPPTAEDLAFFRGMPKRMQYVSSRIRYEKTELRRDAFRCHVGYTHTTGTGLNAFDFRVIRDVWYCEEVPFGVLKWEERIQDVQDRKPFSSQVWQAVSAGKFLPRLEHSPF